MIMLIAFLHGVLTKVSVSVSYYKIVLYNDWKLANT